MVSYLKNVVRLMSARWLWFYVASWMLFTTAIAFSDGTNITPPVDQYLYYRAADSLARMGIILSAISLVLGCLLRMLKERKIWLGIALFVPTSIAMLFAGALINPFGYVLSHLDDQSLNDHIYNLESYPLTEFGTPYGNDFATSTVYIFYECDTSNIFCTAIYYEKFEGGLVSNRSSENTFLHVNDGKVVLHVGGEIVYSHDP